MADTIQDKPEGAVTGQEYWEGTRVIRGSASLRNPQEISEIQPHSSEKQECLDDMHRCPVCFFARLWRPPEDYLICPSCGTEFGYSDIGRSFESLRHYWISTGPAWQSNVILQPPDWAIDMPTLTQSLADYFEREGIHPTASE